MDSLITAAARALAAGDPIGALKRIALREDPPALALRGIAMAQLGDLSRAKLLLRRAARAFGPQEPVARARCVVAEAEIALATRELTWGPKPLAAARALLAAHGDRINAAHAGYLEARRLLLIGRIDAAEQTLAGLTPAPLPPALQAAHALLAAGIAMRRLRSHAAHQALAQARHAAQLAAIPALSAEVESAARALHAPAARLIARGTARPLLLAEVEALLASPVLVVDACRNAVRQGTTPQGNTPEGNTPQGNTPQGTKLVSLARRPVLFALARALAEAWPNEAPRETLLARAFRARQADDSHRARLRVEMGRLRAALRPLADLRATPGGFALLPHTAPEIMVLARPMEEEHAPLLAFLADGEAWSSSALALALGISQRTVQRALDTLAAAGKVQPYGRARARRWTTPPLPGFATVLLLPATLPGD